MATHSSSIAREIPRTEESACCSSRSHKESDMTEHTCTLPGRSLSYSGKPICTFHSWNATATLTTSGLSKMPHLLTQYPHNVALDPIAYFYDQRIITVGTAYDILLALMMLWKCCTQYTSKSGKLSSGHRIEKGQFSFQSQRKAMPKNVQTTA